MQQIYSVACKVEVTYELPDLSTALRQIQSQYASIAAKNLQVRCNVLLFMTYNQYCFYYQGSHLKVALTRFFPSQDMDTWYRSKFQDLSNASATHIQSMQSVRDEITGNKRDVSMTYY